MEAGGLQGGAEGVAFGHQTELCCVDPVLSVLQLHRSFGLAARDWLVWWLQSAARLG